MAADGPLVRVLHLESAPSIINIHDDQSGLVAVYARVGTFEILGTAWYVFSHLR